MPDEPVLKPGKQTFFFGLFAVLALLFSLMGLYFGGVTRNQFMLISGCLVLVNIVSWCRGVKRVMNSCTVQTNALVREVGTWDDGVMLCVQYTVNGEQIDRVLSFSGDKVPAEGDYVKIYYSPKDAHLCLLATCKEEPTRQTNVSPKTYKSAMVSGFALGGFLLVLGIVLLGAKMYLYGRLDGIATGIVVDYVEATGRPYDLELQPAVAFIYEGAEYVGLSYDSWLFQTLDVGEEVTVHFFTSDPTGVVIEGNIGTYLGAALIFLVAAFFIYSGVKARQRLLALDE